jgi:outer membrane protein assembly factor BamB
MGFASAKIFDVQAPAQWTQFRLRGDNNAVLSGSLNATWRISTNGGFSSSPTLSNNTLYIGNNAGELFAIDPSSGTIRWKYRVQNPIMSSPLVYGNLIIVGEGNENSPDGSSPAHPIRVGDPPNALIAVNRLTGAPVWRVDLQGSGMPTPAIIGGVLVHHNGSGELLGINPLTGAVLYKRDLHSIASMTAATPTGGDRFVTAGIEPTAVWMLDAKNGTAIWESSFSPISSGLGDCPPASDGARIYCDYVMPPTSTVPVQTERMANFRAYAVDLRTGKKAWDVQLESGELPKRNEAAIPLLVNGTVYLGSSVAPVMHAIDARTGAIKWRAPTHGPIKGAIVDVGGVLYFGDLAGYLWALQDSNGSVVGVKNMHTPFNVGSPIVAGNTLIIGSRGGTLLAIPLEQIRASHDA